jgi:hypothetical protein
MFIYVNLGYRQTFLENFVSLSIEDTVIKKFECYKHFASNHMANCDFWLSVNNSLVFTLVCLYLFGVF